MTGDEEHIDDAGDQTAYQETVYEALAAAGSDDRWAFGTGFEDPLAGMDASVPAGIDGADLAAYCVMLGDDALILAHRLQQWVAHLPELEEEAAVANIALDLLGQARLLLARAGQADGSGRDDDGYAFERDDVEFRHVHLVERPDGDFAEMVARLFVFATWRLALFQRLRSSADPVLAAIAAKGVNEVTYHRDYAAGWVVRLGDGTELSHRRMQSALGVVWPMVEELFRSHAVERRLAGIAPRLRAVPSSAPTRGAAGRDADGSGAGAPGGVAVGPVAVDPADLRAEVDEVLDEVLDLATLARPDATVPGEAEPAGRDGVHTEAFGPLLAELQSVARAYPGATW